MYARGFSPRAREDALYEATGDMVLSRSSVSKGPEVLWEEEEKLQNRDLSGYEGEYLFFDG